MQLEIDRLRRRQRCERRRRTPSDSDPSSDDDGDGSYKPRSRTPPSESFSYDEDHYYKRRSKSPSHEGLGNDTMSRALNQISKSLFTCRVEGGKLPRVSHNQHSPMSLFRTMRTVITNRGVRVHLAKVWTMIL